MVHVLLYCIYNIKTIVEKRKKKKRAIPMVKRARIVQPLSGSAGFAWPCIEVRMSTIEKGGAGVFATQNLKPGLMFPLIGRSIPEDTFAQMQQNGTCTHCWVTTRGPVDGHPSINPFHNVGNRGLSIAMMINEPTRTKPNCIFKLDHVITARRIRKGEELTIYYGAQYEPIRRRLGYSLDKNKYLDEFYKDLFEMRYPSKAQRDQNISILNRIITVGDHESDEEHDDDNEEGER
jgi:hypothetical protein